MQIVGTEHLALFVASGILLNLTPGQDTLYIVGRSVSQGRRAGLLSVLGISSGTVIHTLAATFGLSALLATSARAFTVVKLAGALYLGYLGLRMLLERPATAEAPGRVVRKGPWTIYRDAFFTNVLNPKVALFFLAFLPQFVAPAAHSRILSFLFLGSIFICTGTLWCLVLAWSASSMSRRLRKNRRSALLLKRATGALFLGLGAKLVVSH